MSEHIANILTMALQLGLEYSQNCHIFYKKSGVYELNCSDCRAYNWPLI